MKISENSEQLLTNAEIIRQKLRKDNSNKYIIEEETNPLFAFIKSIHASKSIIQDNSTHQQINMTFN